MRLTGVERFFVAGTVAVSFAAASGSAAGAIVVGNATEFTVAVERLRSSGGTIVLRPNRYGELVVADRAPRWLTIRAQRGASAGRVVLVRTQAVRISGLRVSPRSRHASISIERSRNVAFHRLTVSGGTRFGANASVRRSSNIRFVASRFTRCGEGTASRAGYCLQLTGTNGVRIVGAHFHDCRGCDFIHGSGATTLTLRESTLERALAGRCGRSVRRCHHQDLVHLRGGRNLVFDRNRFGIYEMPGAAQLYLTDGIRGVTVTNNLFVGTDPALPGYRAPHALWIGNRLDDEVPRRVVIAENTILTGRPRRLRGESFVTASSVVLSRVYLYSGLRRSLRPVVANNVIALAASRAHMCSQVRTSVRNVILVGAPCARSDVVGDPALDGRGRPTRASALLIDRADVRYATRHDLVGVPRGDRPDIGAYEYVGG